MMVRTSTLQTYLQCILLLDVLMIYPAVVPPATLADSQQADCMLEWLLSLGINQDLAATYRSNFSSELVDQTTLKLMSENDLKAVGVVALGHRILIHHAATTGTHDTCRHGGSCNYDTVAQEYHCTCPAGFAGRNCQNVVNGCDGNLPCKNGGTCRETTDNNTICCICPEGYHGDLCQHVSEDPEQAFLAQTVMNLTQEVERVKESQASALAFADNMRRSTGLRYFKHWVEIDLHNAFFIRHFTIGSRCFLGVVCHSMRREIKHYNGVNIYELVDSQSLVYIQTISNVTASSFKLFFLQGFHYMIVGHEVNHYAGRHPLRVNSELYRWNDASGNFSLSTSPGISNEIRTVGVKDVDYVMLPDNNSFLAFASYEDVVEGAVHTIIYRHHPSRYDGNVFFHHGPDLVTVGARRVKFFTFNSTTYLFVAEEKSANSSVFHWHSDRFVLFQKIVTNFANDLLPFSIGDNFFVVAVNYKRGNFHNIQSIVYILRDREFVFYAALDTKGARKAEFFTVGTECFLAFSNAWDDTTAKSTTSVIYRVEGGSFVHFQDISTNDAAYVHVFTLQNGCTVLAVANKLGKPQLYKWNTC